MILSNRLQNALQQDSIKPLIVLEIDGVPFLIGSDTIKKIPRYGDDGLYYGDSGLIYGGLIEYPGQKTLISLSGTTTQIKQNLEPDKARGSGISQMTINLVDLNGEATKLLAGSYGEILFRNVKVWISFGENTAWNEDFIIVFRGLIESVEAGQGSCKLYLSSPDQKKRSQPFIKAETTLDGAITDSDTSLVIDDIDNFFQVPEHPAYSGQDPNITTCLLIDDELMSYTSISGTTISGITRGIEGTVAVVHEDEATVNSFLIVSGNAMDIALKLMLSDKDMTSYLEGLPCYQTNTTGTATSSNTFYIADTNLNRDKLVRRGDYVKSSGFTETENNLGDWTEILDVITVDSGSYIIVDASLVDEANASGELEFLSQFNSFGAFGVGLNQDDVDVDQHVLFRNSFLTTFEMKFFIRDDIEEGKGWIENELYLPASCYSLPTDRNGLSRVSLGIHKPPIPGAGIVTLSERNVMNPDTLSIERSVNKNYYNAIVFKFEDSVLDEELRRRRVTLVGTQQVPTGNKPMIIESKGMRIANSANSLADTSSTRLLQRYQGAAEFLRGVSVLFRDAVQIVAGDIVVLDPSNLNLIDNASASRSKGPLLMEVVNKTIDIRNGSSKLDLVSTAFNIDARFGLISPASKIYRAVSGTKYVITHLYSESPTYGPSEYRKWSGLTQPKVVIRSQDFSDLHITTLVSANSNTIEVETAPSFTVSEGYVLEFASYSYCTTEQKLVYAFLTEGSSDFSDGGEPYVFI